MAPVMQNDICLEKPALNKRTRLQTHLGTRFELLRKTPKEGALSLEQVRLRITKFLFIIIVIITIVISQRPNTRAVGGEVAWEGI